MTALKFEDLQVWKDSRIFVKSIYEMTSAERFQKDYGLKDQIQRAAVSVLNNISEGFERNSTNEFVKFLNYSKGSAGEVRSMLYVALDLGYISQEQFQINYESSINIITQIANFVKYLRRYSVKQKMEKLRLFLFNLSIF